jgi:tetratricopeptide (TPR) repeat protein
VAAATLDPQERRPQLRRLVALAILLAFGAVTQALILSQQLASDPLAPLPTAWLTLPALVVLAWLLRDPRRYLPEALLLFAPLATVVIFWYSPRYRMPALPLLAMLSGYAAVVAFRDRAPVLVGSVAAAFLVSIGSGPWNRRIGFDAPATYSAQYEHTLGGALLELKRLPEAEVRFRAALAAGHAPAAAALADVLRREGRREEAIEMLRETVEKQPANAYAHKSLAVALAEAGSFPEAEREYRATIAIDPNDAEALSGLGNVLHSIGHDTDSIAMHRSAIERKPEYAGAHYNLGCVLFANKRIPEAEAEFREALRLDPGLAQAQWYLHQIRGGHP